MMEKHLLSKPVRNVQSGGGHFPEWPQCIPAHSLPQCLTVLPRCWAPQMPDSSSSKRYFHLFLRTFLPGLPLPKLMPFAVHQTTYQKARTLFPLLGSMGSDYSFSPQVDLVGLHPFMPSETPAQAPLPLPTLAPWGSTAQAHSTPDSGCEHPGWGP